MQRLKTRAQFQAVLAGETLARTPHFALHAVALTPSVRVQAADQSPATQPLFNQYTVWLGVMAPKRWAKRAVTRHAIKRQVYAVSLEFEPSLACAAHVVRLRSGFDRQLFISATSPALKTTVRLELQQLFAKAVGLSPPKFSKTA